MNVTTVVGGKLGYQFFEKSHEPPPASDTPADVLKSFGLNPDRGARLPHPERLPGWPGRRLR